jgi:hypothetical protein
MNNLNKTIEEINEIIEWYHGLPMDYNGINEIMFQRVQLITHLAFYSSEMSDARIRWKNAEAETERVRRTETKKAMSLNLPMAKAVEIGKFESINEYANEKQWDGVYYQMRTFFDVCNGIIDAMNQHISNLKREENQQKSV